MSASPLGLDWTGHALVDVGLAGVCALNGLSTPRDVSLQHLDVVSDFIAEHYFSGALDPYLSVVFTNNSGYCGPNKVKDPGDYAEVFRAHRVAPNEHLRGAPGELCAFSGLAASAFVHRQHLPLFSADQVLNFRPRGQGSVPVAAPILVALQFLPMAGRRAEGKMLLAHADDPDLTLRFAARYLSDNRRLLGLKLPTEPRPVHDEFAREVPKWDAGKKRFKMADAKGPRSLLIHDLTEIAAESAATDSRPVPIAVTAYHLSNSGQGPSLDVHVVPSGVVRFVRRASLGSTREAWQAIASRFWPVSRDRDRDEGSAKPAKRKRGEAPVAPPQGRAGWTRNPAFEELCDVFAAGFTDRGLAALWLGRYLLGRLERRGGRPDYRDTRARDWALAELFIVEVLGMTKARISAIKAFADKLADRVLRKNDRALFRTLVLTSKSWELRRGLVRAQQKSAEEGDLLFGTDEYATVFLADERDENLARDLICIRVVERLHEGRWFEEHPEERLEAPAEEANP